LARKNKHVELKPVDVEVFDFRLLEIEGPQARFAIECAAGTYVRSLAHDMGAHLGCGAHLAEITRTAVGEFTLDRAVGLDDFARAVQEGKAEDCILPLGRLLSDLPRVSVSPVVERRVRHGSSFQVSLAQIEPSRAEAPQGSSRLDNGDWKPGRLRVFDLQGRLIAIAEAVVPRTYQPVLVIDAEP
jgi:tRNA pseudouridine55 synthase